MLDQFTSEIGNAFRTYAEPGNIRADRLAEKAFEIDLRTNKQIAYCLGSIANRCLELGDIDAEDSLLALKEFMSDYELEFAIVPEEFPALVDYFS